MAACKKKYIKKLENCFGFQPVVVKGLKNNKAKQLLRSVHISNSNSLKIGGYLRFQIVQSNKFVKTNKVEKLFETGVHEGLRNDFLSQK